MRSTLTENAVRAAEPGTTLWDGSLKHFGLRVAPGGTKSFIVLLASGRRQAIGRYPAIKLADARAKARRILAERTLGRHQTSSVGWQTAVAKFLDARRTAIKTGSSEQESTNPSQDTEEATDTPPQIQINGDNPAIVQVGATYNDLGATITGPQADLNLGIETYLNGSPMSPVQIDTSQAATETIDYVATDQNGLTSTSTRTVMVEAPSIVPFNDASSTAAATTTAATTTSQ